MRISSLFSVPFSSHHSCNTRSHVLTKGLQESDLKCHFLPTCLLRSIHLYHYGHFIPVHIVRNNLQACLHSYLKKNKQSYFWSRVLALCKRWRLGAVWCCYGWLAAASVLLDLQAPLMSKGIVLAALLIILSTERERWRKLRLPLDTSKQTKVCRVWFIPRMSVIQTSLRILMSSVGIIVLNIVLAW